MLDKPLFKSKRFISAVVGVIIMMVVAFVPQLDAYQGEIVDAITEIIMALVAGYSLTDIAREWLNRRGTDQ